MPFWNRLFTTSCFDVSTTFESCWSKNCTNLLSDIHDQSTQAWLLAWFVPQNATPYLLSRKHLQVCAVVHMCDSILGQQKLKANDRQLTSRKTQKQLLFWSGQWSSDSSSSATDGSFDIGLGKPSELGNSLLSTNQGPFIYTGPQALSWWPSMMSQVGPGSRPGWSPAAFCWERNWCPSCVILWLGSASCRELWEGRRRSR